MNAGASLSAVPSPIEGSGTAWVLLGSWALSPARPTPIPPRHECRGFSALLVIRAIPADVRLALPVSHGNLLPSERGGSLKGGSLRQFYARRNGRASASLTARGGGLPIGVIPGGYRKPCAARR